MAISNTYLGLRKAHVNLRAAAKGADNDPRGLISLRSIKMPKCLARTMLDNMVSRLTPRQIQVISLRFGLGDIGPLTNGETGNILKVSKQRISTIEAHALRKLKAMWARGVKMPGWMLSQYALTPFEIIKIRSMLRSDFTPRESYIMLLRLGFSLGSRLERAPHSAEYVSWICSVSKEKVRKTEERFMDLLDDPSITAKLNILLDPYAGTGIAGIKNVVSWGSILF